MAVALPLGDPEVPSYTKKITLEEVTQEEFWGFINFWGKNIHFYPDWRYARIQNPVMEADYEQLLHRLFDHPLCVQVDVNNQGQWQRLFKDSVSEGSIKHFAWVAARDRKKRNYLEAKIGPSYVLPWVEKAVIEFLEYQGKIIGYDMTVPYARRELFTIQQKSDEPGTWQKMMGLWVPG